MIYWAKLRGNLYLKSNCTGLGFAENNIGLLFSSKAAKYQNFVFIKTTHMIANIS